MVLLEKLWDDVVAGPQPDRGLGRLRKITTQPINIRGDGGSKVMHRSMTMPASVSPGTPTTPTTPTTPRKDNVWRSVFNPGSNLATRSIGSNVFDKPKYLTIRILLRSTTVDIQWVRLAKYNGAGARGGASSSANAILF